MPGIEPQMNMIVKVAFGILVFIFFIIVIIYLRNMV